MTKSYLKTTNPLRFLNYSAIMTGLLVDILCSFIIALGLSFMIGLRLRVEGIDQPQFETAFIAVTQAFSFQLLMLAGGLFSTAAGAFAASRIAKRLEYFHASSVGVLALLIGLATNSGQMSGNIQWIGLLLVIPAALLGGRQAKRTRRHPA